MSYRVILADDEPKMLALIKMLGRWDEYDIEIIDECTDGRQTYESILKNKPDFVLSDIKMPELDGLQLIEAVRQAGCDCFFVLISGYRHFEYARTAVSLNVMDYLLKPIDEDQLNRTLEKMCMQVRTKREAAKDLMELHQIRIEKKQEEWKQFWQDMLYNHYLSTADEVVSRIHYNMSAPELCNAAYHTEFFPGSYQCVRICTNISSMLGKENSLLNTTLEKFVQKTIGQQAYCCYHITQKGVILILNFQPPKKRWIREMITTLYYHIRDMEEIYGDFCLNFGCSLVHQSVSELILMLDEAMSAEWGRLHSMSNGILEYSQVAYLKRFSTSDIYTAKEVEDMVACVKYLRREELGDLFGKITQKASVYMNSHPEDMAHAFYNLVSKLVEAMPEEEKEFFHERAYQAYVESKNYPAVFRKLYHVLDENLLRMQDKIKQKNGKPIQEAIRYIQEYYARPLSLEEVAEQSNVSPTYLSKLFKEELGINFVDYLTRIRLDTAEKLLADSTMTIKEIAMRVGYPDEKYFSKTFKKVTGIKPTEYRKIYG